MVDARGRRELCMAQENLNVPILQTNVNKAIDGADTNSQGLFLGIIIGVISAAPILTSGPSSLLSLSCIIVVPLLLISVVMPRSRFRLINFLVPVAISELLLGGTGAWIKLGAFSGRSILFVIVLVGWIFDWLISPKAFVGRHWGYIFLIGFVAPLFWLAWSLGQGAHLSFAFEDLNFLFYLLLYFPISIWLRDGPPLSWTKGYFAGLLLVQAALGIFGPLYTWIEGVPPRMVDWFAGNVTYFPNGFPRLSLNVDVFFPVGIWLGLLMWHSKSKGIQSRVVRMLGSILFATSAVALALTFSRAIWLASAVVALIGLVIGNARWIARRKGRRFLLGLCLIVVIAFALMVHMSPEGFGRFYSVFNLEEQANRIRVEQSAELIHAWKARPLLGNGFGTAPRGYIRSSKTPYLFELQYHALLFKGGIVGLLLIITIPLAAFIIYHRSIRWLFRPAVTNSASLLISVTYGVLVTCIAGAFNPYLTSAYFTSMVALLFALYDSILCWNRRGV